MAVKDRRESQISPVLFKFGVALAVSLGGIVYTFFTRKRIMPFKPKPSSLPSPGIADLREESDDVGDKDQALQSSINGLSSSGRLVVDRDGILLSELDQLIKEYDMETDDVSSGMNGERLVTNCAEKEECITEISNLRSKVKILEERERILENQLLEYYGLKEQETAVKELQNRLRVHNMEAKLYSLKIESLQSDNKKLHAKVADYEKVVTELESAQAKIKLLRKKLRLEAEQNRDQILNLQERVMKLQDHEKKPIGDDQDAEMQLKKLKEMEEELEEMKKYNQSLKLENSELTRKLESLQMLARSTLNDEEVQALKEERELLRQQNEDLRQEIEQLQANRCTDIEELVYLRWINACLRYEMRNYQPRSDETIARDLSKTLSPKSEEKAKKLILAYANKEGSRDFDSDQWSSYLTDSGEPDDLPLDILPDIKTSHPNKTKVFTKLMKLLRGKDTHHHLQTTPSPQSMDDTVSRYSSNSQSGISLSVDVGAAARTSSGGSSRQSFNLQKSTTGESSKCSRRASDDGSLSIFRSIDSMRGYNDNPPPGTQPHQDAQDAARTELVKYAEALKISRANPSFRRRSAAFGSF